MSVVLLPSAHRDRDAAAIGKLYRQGRASLADSLRCHLQCGKQLVQKKSTLKSGAWLPWLRENADVLGFETRRTASRLMSAWKSWCKKHGDNPEEANESLTTHLPSLGCDEVTELIQGMWDNDDDDDSVPGDSDSTNWNQSNSNEHYTPAVYIDAAREALGSIDLDPASCTAANRIVKAKTFYSEDGEHKPWRGHVWLNPPYGNMVGAFIGKLVEEYATKRVTGAVALVSAHATDTGWFQPLWDHTLCFTNHRIAFSDVGNNVGGSVFVYLGGAPQRFKRIFSEHGAVVKRF